MKKNNTNYTVNKQEDEDGYTPYPEKAIIYENVKREKDVSFHNKAGNTEHGSAKLQSRGFIVTPGDASNRVIKKMTV